MEILADNEIAGVAEAFAQFGRVRLFDGRPLRRSDLANAEILLVRSVTRVDAKLLADTNVRFVGTATAGTDHIDLPALRRLGIKFAAAAGCNARAVAEHVVVCLYEHAAASGQSPHNYRVGIVGFGHVGKTLAALLGSLGIEYLVNDPPLARSGLVPQARPLADILNCAVITLHVPLVESGPTPTRGLIDIDAIAAIVPGALLINAARGGVVDERALVERLRRGPLLAIAIDCWAGEPVPDPALIDVATYATPHIAGHSLEARWSATRMLQTAIAAYLGIEIDSAMPEPASGGQRCLPPGGIAALLREIHSLPDHSGRMRALHLLEPAVRGAHFDAIRRTHGLRREFSAYAVARTGLAPDTVDELRALGFALI